MTTKTETFNILDVDDAAPIVLTDAETIDPFTLAARIVTDPTKGCMVRFHADYPMTETDAKGALKRMNVGRADNRNPFIGKPLIKRSQTSATVRFDYADKVERRDGDRGNATGSWHTVVLIDGKVTALSVHKADVETYLPDDAPKDTIVHRRAVVNDKGNLTYLTDAPRLYLRYEIIRQGKGSERASKPMVSKSVYLLDGQPIDKSEVEPWLKTRSERKDETDMQLTPLDCLTYLAIDGNRYNVVNAAIVN